MALATGVNLADPGAIIDALQTELTAQNWTIDLNTAGGVGVRELYFSKAAVDTFNGEVMSFGIWWAGADRLEISGSANTYAFWTNSGVDLISNNFGAGSMTNPSAVLRNSGTSFWETRVEDLNTGGNYIQHWIFTPVDTALISPVDRQYIYFVTEIQTGVFRSFFFGEMEKYDGDAWGGGLFFEGNSYDAISGRDVRPFDGGFSHNIFAQNRGAGAFYVDQSDPYIVTPSGVNFASIGTIWGVPGDLVNPLEGIGAGERILGEDYQERTPAAFSGQTARWPAELLAQLVQPFSVSQPENVGPFGTIPDFFHTTLADLTPGSVIIDDTESFLVVPHTSKGGTLNSGNRGFLIRNPNL